MRLGALLGPVTGNSPGNLLAEQARTLATEGFDSLWSAQALGRGFMLTDPFVALSVAATAAEDVELGTAVVQAPLYHPMDLAHRIFSLQQVCGNRLIMGLGAGYPGRLRRLLPPLRGTLRGLSGSRRFAAADLPYWRQ